MSATRTRGTCHVCGRNTPYTDWDTCEEHVSRSAAVLAAFDPNATNAKTPADRSQRAPSHEDKAVV